MGEYGAAGDFAAMTIGGEDNLLGPFPLLKVGHVTVRLCNYSGSNRLQQIKEKQVETNNYTSTFLDRLELCQQS